MAIPVQPWKISADSAKFQKAVDLVEAELKEGMFPGAVLVVTQGGRTLLERFWGTYCSRERRDIPYNPSVVNMLYSFSKGIGATIVVMARQRGLIEYDVPLNYYIPEFTGGGKDVITIRHLLTHSAGIPSTPFNAVQTREQWSEALKAVCAMKVEWEPGSICSYHGATGMFLAAETVLRVTGETSWNALCRRWLFEPLGAESLSFDVPVPGAPLALTPQPAELPCPGDVEHFGALGGPGGGCLGTVADVLKVLQLHLNGGVWDGKRLIEADALQEMHTIQNLRQVENARARGQKEEFEYWGLGWQMRGESTAGWFGFGTLASPRAFGHAGIDTVMTVADPERNLAIAFLTTGSPKMSREQIVQFRKTMTDLIVAAAPA